MLKSQKVYRIYGRRQSQINTDPQRRCYYGHHYKYEWVWGDWLYLGTTFTEEEAVASVASWKKLNPKRHDYKYERA